MFELDESLSQLYMEHLLDYEAYGHAIKLAKERGLTEDDCRPLIAAKLEINNDMETVRHKILKQMPSNDNIVRICKDFFGIRFIEDKTVQLKCDFFNEDELHFVSLGQERIRDFTRTDIERYLPMIEIDPKQVKESRMDEINCRACELLFEVLGIEIIPNTDKLSVSAHAIDRWCQRKLKMTKSQAAEHKRKNYQQLQETITKIFQSAEKIWTDEELYEYWFDEENILYVFRDNVIVTLYEKDYGFTKEINRMITLKQLNVLAAAWRDYQNMQSNYMNETNVLEDRIAAFDAQICSLQSQMDYIKSERQLLLDTEGNHNLKVKVAYDNYQAEFVKLFKKWDVKESA